MIKSTFKIHFRRTVKSKDPISGKKCYYPDQKLFTKLIKLDELIVYHKIIKTIYKKKIIKLFYQAVKIQKLILIIRNN